MSGLLESGQHMGVSGESDKVHKVINARLKDVVFNRLGLVETQIKKGDGINLGAAAGTSQYVAYGALLDRHTTTQTFAMALCARINGEDLVTPAITLDRLPWSQLHIRTFTDNEFGDLCNQKALNWDNLGVPQQLPFDAYENAPTVRLYRDPVNNKDRWARDSNVCTYRTKDGTLAIAVAPERDGTVGNDMPKESTFEPVFELFNCVIWFA